MLWITLSHSGEQTGGSGEGVPLPLPPEKHPQRKYKPFTNQSYLQKLLRKNVMTKTPHLLFFWKDETLSCLPTALHPCSISAALLFGHPSPWPLKSRYVLFIDVCLFPTPSRDLIAVLKAVPISKTNLTTSNKLISPSPNALSTQRDNANDVTLLFLAN